MFKQFSFGMIYTKTIFPKVLTLLVFSFLYPFFVFSQQKKINQLLSDWKRLSANGKLQSDTVAINILNALGDEYLHTVSDSAYICANKALSLSESLKYPKGISEACATIAKMHYMKGNYDLSLTQALRSLKLSSQNGNISGVATATNSIGLIYLAQEKDTLALKEFLKAASINKALNIQNKLAGNYFNAGLCFLEIKSDSAIYYLHLAKSISTKIHDEHLLAMTNNRLGDFYLQKGQTQKAISFYASVLQNRAYQNDWENSFAYTGLANCYYKLGKYKVAVSYSQKGYWLAKKTNTKWDIERALNVLYKSYTALGDSGKAYMYLLMDKQYSDSLFSESKEKEINALNLKQKQAEYEVLVKKNQIVQQQQATNRMVIIIIVLIALFLMIITVMTFRGAERMKKLYQDLQKKSDYIVAQKQLIEQKNDELNNSNQTKDRLFSIIAHDLRSPFGAMIGTLQLIKAGMLNEKEKQFMFDRLFEQVTVTSAMLEHLLTWANSQREGLKTEMISLSLTQVIDEVIAVSVAVANEKKIQLVHQHDENPMLILADPDQIRIIFQNLVANAIKFTQPEGTIVVSYLLGEKTISVSVKDTGVGMSEAKLEQIFQESGKKVSTYGTKNEKGIGLGLVLVKKFVELNNATISVSSKEQEGTEFVITFKY
ncbi:tetratricopeptide repeat-containing sensor histidine kinase [Flectobacillus major]|uniref:tetratricopeptide repeat-containing sensor histidine kinase n=1 Tax=Flectobacillus major TaxID=103 RepID=UPI000409DC74|nr:ATP-binding protein [Flectobacillus major]